MALPLSHLQAFNIPCPSTHLPCVDKNDAELSHHAAVDLINVSEVGPQLFVVLTVLTILLNCGRDRKKQIVDGGGDLR